MATSRELLWSFGVDTSSFKKALNEIAGMLEDLSDDQKKAQKAQQDALDDYLASVQKITSAFSPLTDQLEKQADLIKDMSASYASMVGSIKTHLNAISGAGRGGGGLPKGGGQRAPESIPEWQRAAADLRTGVAQELLSTKEVAQERQRIVSLIDIELKALKQKSELSKQDLTNQNRLTLERERQSDALKNNTDRGLTTGTREALARVGQSALGGGSLGAGLIGGLVGGGSVALLQGATEALSGFVAKVRELVENSDKLVNVENVFDRLSEGIGAKPTEYIENLTQATHGLVDAHDLMSNANRMMMQSADLSQGQIEGLIKSVSTLSLVQGRDVTESFAAVTRAVATGRMSMLSFQLGLEGTTRESLAYANQLHGSARVQEEYAIIQNAINDQLAKTGDYTETAGTKIREANVHFEELAHTLATSIGQSDFINSLADAWDKLAGALANYAKAPHPILNAIKGESYDKGASGGIVGILDFALSAMSGAGGLAGYDIRHGAAGVGPTIGALPLDRRAPAVIGVQAPPKPEPPDWEANKRFAEEQAKAEEQLAQQRLDNEKTDAEAVREIWKQAYESGAVDLRTYVDEEKKIRADQTKSEIDFAGAQRTEKLAGLAEDEKRAKTESVTPAALASRMKEINAKRDTINAEYDTKTNSLKDKQNLDDMKDEEQIFKDHQTALKTNVEKDYSIVKEGADEQKMVLQQQWEDGAISADQYFSGLKSQAADDLSNTMDYINKKYALVAEGEAKQAALGKDVTEAQEQYQKTLTQITLSELDKRLAASEKTYKGKGGFLGAQLDISRTMEGKTGITTGGSVSILQQMVTETQKFIDEQTKLAAKLNETGSEHSDEWYKIQTGIMNAREELIKYNEQLLDSRDALGPLGSLFGGISGFLGGAITGHAKTWAVEGLGMGMQTLTGISGANKSAAGTMGLGGGSQDMLSVVKKGFTGLGDITLNTTTKLKNFSAALEDAVANVAGWAQVASGRQGPAGGFLAGGGMGAQLGIGLTGKDSLTGLTGMAGGALTAGLGAVGGLVGLLSGKARQETQKIAQQISDQFNDVTNALNVGATDLSNAIEQTQALKAQAQQQLSGQKGGQDQLNQLMPQFNQTIMQLQAQQRQIEDQFIETTQIITQPQPYQQYLNNIEQIVQKYQQYIDAGGSVAEANANLSASFQNLAIQSQQSLYQDEASAVQNAIQVQDLQLQMQQLQLQNQQFTLQQQQLTLQIAEFQYQQQFAVANYYQQLENILGQGGVTRQLPTAMTKGLQVAQLQQQFAFQQQSAALQAQQYTMQQAQMDLQQKQMVDQQQNLQQQIDVANYTLQIQQQIFDLAQTRLGLEQQLTAVQEQQAQYQASQTQALQNVISVLADPNTQTMVEAMLQASTVAATQITQAIQALLNATPGIGQAQGQPASIPGFAEGGVVQADTLAYVHAGETITPANASDHMTARLSTESQIVSMANVRLQTEQQIYQMQLNLIAALSAAGISGGSGNMENSILQTYVNRGRQGLSGFYGELG